MTSLQPAPRSQRPASARPHVLPWVLLAIGVVGLSLSLVAWLEPAVFQRDTFALIIAVVLAHRVLVPVAAPERALWTHALTLGFVFAAFMTSGALAGGVVALASAVSGAVTNHWLQRNDHSHQRWAPGWAFTVARTLLGVLLGLGAVAAFLDLHPSTPGETRPVSIFVFAAAFLVVAVMLEVMAFWKGEPEWLARPASRWTDWGLGAIVPAILWDAFVVGLAVAVGVLVDSLAVRIGVPVAVAIAFIALAAVSRLVDLNARLRERNRALARATAELRTLNAIGQTLSATLELDELCQELARQVLRVMPADAMLIGLYDPASGEIRFPFHSYSGIRQPPRVEHVGSPTEGAATTLANPPRHNDSPGDEASDPSHASASAATVHHVSGGIVPRVLATRLPVLGDDTETFPLHRSDGTPLPKFRSGVRRFRSVLGVPLLTGGRIIGVLCVKRHRPNAYGLDQVALLTSIANQAAVAIQNAQLFEEQRAAVQAKQDFLSVVSHELRTPITSVSGYTQLLRRRLNREAADGQERLTDSRLIASYLQIVAVIEDQSRHLARLVDDLIQLSRLESGRLSFSFEPMDLAIVTQEAVEAVQLTGGHERITRETPDTLSMVGDAFRLRQVLDNLLENAVKYAPEPATIRVELCERHDEIIMRVIDTGPGIPASNIPHLFEPFYRVQGDDGTTQRGLGLGLSICREIAIAHRGSITVTSEPGEGTTFTIRLPTATTVAGRRADESPRSVDEHS